MEGDSSHSAADQRRVASTSGRTSSSNSHRLSYFAREEEFFREQRKSRSTHSALPNFGIPVRANDPESQVYLAVVWQSGILGAALYNAETAAVDLLMDVPDKPPFEVLRSLIAVVEPFCVIISQGTDDRLKDFLAKICDRSERNKPEDGLDDGDSSALQRRPHDGDGDSSAPQRRPHDGDDDSSALQRRPLDGDDDSSAPQRRPHDGDGDRPTGPKLHLLSTKDFALGPARQRIGRVRLPSMPEHLHDSDAVRLFLDSVIDFRRFAMVRSFGGLLTFMDRVPPVGADGNVPILAIRMFTMEDDVAVDQNSLNALRVFHANSHPSAFKAGKGGKEGFSLFALFNHCKSSVGKKMLRLWFGRPTRNIDILRSRHQAIRFFMNSQNSTLKAEFEKILATLKDVTSTMSRMAKGACTLSDWMALEKTSLCGFLISKVVEREDLPLDIEIFGKIRDTFSKDLARIAKIIHDVVDFEASEIEERFVVNPGVAEELDDMKRRLISLNETLTYVATQELARMEGETREIRVTYIPNMGYLLVLDKDHTNDQSSDFAIPGLEFVFKAKSGLFYKSERMRELDNDDANFGDLTPKIHDCEREIMIQLQNVVLRYTETLFDVMYGAAELDCLISIASTAVHRNYVVPEIDEEYGISIEDGRHPLQELCVTEFVPNSTDLGQNKGRVSIITGPNMCGKSVYLKQVAIIVFLTHIGCPVPASAARIGLVDKIFTRLLSEETVAVRQSAFLIDLTQVGMAVNYATEKSLIILDEFGKGTRSSDGLALLASILHYFVSGAFQDTPSLDKGVCPPREELEKCSSFGVSQFFVGKSPFILLATHFHSLSQLIPASDIVHYLTLEHMQSDSDNLVFLYKVKSGVSLSSYAVETSRAVGFMDNTLKRIVEITDGLKYNRPIEPLTKLRVAGFSTIASVLMENLMLYDPDTEDARAFLDQTLAIVRRKTQPEARKESSPDAPSVNAERDVPEPSQSQDT